MEATNRDIEWARAKLRWVLSCAALALEELARELRDRQ